MSGDTWLETMRHLGEIAWQVCECGDWRHEHAGGGGRCHTCAASGPAPYNQCKEFRYARDGTPDEIEECKAALRRVGVLREEGGR